MNIIFNDYDGRDSYYDKKYGNYIVWLGKKGNRETNKMHELAHINLGTDMDEARKMVLKWGLKSKLPSDDNTLKLIADLFFTTWNVLEDERVESFSPRLFKQHKKDMGKTKTKKIAKSNPIEALLCARFDRDDLVGKEIKQYIIASRLASKDRVYELAEDYIKMYVIDYIKKSYK
jgi:hypothetical protein